MATQTATEAKVTLDAKLAKEVFDLINKERTAANLPVLVWDNSVAAVASLHGFDMATYKYLDQKGRDNSTVQTRLVLGKVTFTQAAENLAQRTYTADIIVKAWMNSEKHKVNILNKDFTKVGIGVAKALDGTLYWVVDFIK